MYKNITICPYYTTLYFDIYLLPTHIEGKGINMQAKCHITDLPSRPMEHMSFQSDPKKSLL